jgi:hypothetical protein
MATTIRCASAGRLLARGANATANTDDRTIEPVRTAVFIVRSFLQGSLTERASNELDLHGYERMNLAIP